MRIRHCVVVLMTLAVTKDGRVNAHAGEVNLDAAPRCSFHGARGSGEPWGVGWPASSVGYHRGPLDDKVTRVGSLLETLRSIPTSFYPTLIAGGVYLLSLPYRTLRARRLSREDHARFERRARLPRFDRQTLVTLIGTVQADQPGDEVIAVEGLQQGYRGNFNLNPHSTINDELTMSVKPFTLRADGVRDKLRVVPKRLLLERIVAASEHVPSHRPPIPLRIERLRDGDRVLVSALVAKRREGEPIVLRPIRIEAKSVCVMRDELVRRHYRMMNLVMVPLSALSLFFAMAGADGRVATASMVLQCMVVGMFASFSLYITYIGNDRPFLVSRKHL